MSRITWWCNKYLLKHLWSSFATLLIGAAFSQTVYAQVITFGSPVKLTNNNVANQGSPILLAGSALLMYYVNHSNSTIYLDGGNGVNGMLGNNFTSTGIVVYSGELTDVGVSDFSSNIVLSYVAPDQQIEFAVSTNGGTIFGTPVSPSASSLGLPSGVSPSPAFVPAIVSDDAFEATIYVATVGSDGRVYMSTTTNGVTFTPLSSADPVSSNITISRPSLTMYNGVPWVAFTTTGRIAVIGNATHNNAPEVAGGVIWGNSNRDGHYAGLALWANGGLGTSTYLYAFGQDTASSQNLKYIYSANGSSWSGPEFTGNQMRWTPSVNEGVLVYQDDGDTDISYRVEN